MARASHKHEYRIVSHTTEAKGKDVRVLISCKCSDTDVLRPHQGKKKDLAFAEKIQQYAHLCCTPNLAQAA